MNKKLLAQLALPAMLMISLAACQKSNSNAPSAQPTNADTQVPNEQKALSPEAEAEQPLKQKLGLNFVDIPAADAGEDSYGYENKVAWDAKEYRRFLKEKRKNGEAVLDLESQKKLLSDYVVAANKVIHDVLDAQAENGLSEDPAEQAAHLQRRNRILARIELAQARIVKLQKKMDRLGILGPQAPTEDQTDVPVEPTEGEATTA